MELPTFPSPLLSGLTLMMGGIMVGLTLAYTSSSYMPIQAEFNTSDSQMTLFTIISYIMAFPGSLMINALGTCIGKRVCIMVSVIIAAGSYITMASAKSMTLLMVMRALSGISMGSLSSLCPPYLVEIAPPGKQSRYSFFNQIGLAIGFLLTNLVSTFAKWRAMTYIFSAPAILCFIGSFFIPAKVTTTDHTQGSFYKVFKYPKELFIAFTLCVFLQFSGINALLSNLQKIISKSGVSISMKLIAIIANLVQILATILASIVVDKFGRKTCWTVSAAGQLIAFVILALQQLVPLNGVYFIVGLLLEQLSYGVGTGPIPFSMAATLFPKEVSSPGMAITSGLSYLVGALVCYIWPTLEGSLGLGFSFVFFGAVQIISIIFGLFAMTKHRTKRDDDEYSSSDMSSDPDEPLSRRLSHARDLAEQPEL